MNKRNENSINTAKFGLDLAMSVPMKPSKTFPPDGRSNKRLKSSLSFGTLATDGDDNDTNVVVIQAGKTTTTTTSIADSYSSSSSCSIREHNSNDDEDDGFFLLAPQELSNEEVLRPKVRRAIEQSQDSTPVERTTINGITMPVLRGRRFAPAVVSPPDGSISPKRVRNRTVVPSHVDEQPRITTDATTTTTTTRSSLQHNHDLEHLFLPIQDDDDEDSNSSKKTKKKNNDSDEDDDDDLLFEISSLNRPKRFVVPLLPFRPSGGGGRSHIPRRRSGEEDRFFVYL